MASPNPPAPSRVVNALAAFQLSSALRAALEIDLFVAIGDGFTTPEALALRCQADARGVRTLADYLVIQQFLAKQSGRYSLTEEARLYLDRRSPSYVCYSLEFVQAPFVRQQFDQLADIVRRGGAEPEKNVLQPNHEMWVRFARAMAPQMATVAEALAPKLKELLHLDSRAAFKVLDVAASHGLFGIMLALQNPNCQVTAQDWPEVLKVAEENARKWGVIKRFQMLPGSIADVVLGSDFDLIVLPNLMHQFDRPTNMAMLKKLRAALKPGGVLATVEFAPNEDRISPASHGAFGLFLLATTPGGEAYTVGEIGAMYAEAGFENLSAHELGIQRLIVGANPKIGTTWSVGSNQALSGRLAGV